MRLGYKLTGLFLIFTLSITIFFYFVGLKNQKKDFETVSIEHINNIKATFHNLEERDTKILFSTLEVIVQDLGLQAAYLESNRENLFDYGQPLFQKLKNKYGITHFYFIQPDGRVYLRMHNKYIYGDIVERASFQKSRDTKGPAWEIELGKTAFALRTVMPYYEGDNLIGYVELGEEIDHFLQILKGETNSEFGLFADKKYLNRDNWMSTRQVAGLRDNWDDMDEHLIISSTSKENESERCFVEDNIELVEEGESVFQLIQSKKNAFMCGGFDLTDARGRHIGAILSLTDITGHVAVARKSNNAILRMSLILFFTIFTAGILISRSITKPILKLVEVAKAIGRGDLEKRVKVSSSDEIGQLGRTFNDMIEKRKRVEEELHKSRDELELRVNVRTSELTAINEQLKLEVSERKRIEEALIINQKRLESIKEIGALATSTLNLTGVLHRILEGTLEATGATVGMIFLKDKNTGCLSWGASMGLSDAFVSDYTNQTVNPGEGLTGLIAKTGKTIFIPSNASHDPRIARPVAVAEGFNSFIGVPIYASGKIVGVMNILTRLPDILKEDETKLIAAIGSQVGSTIQNALLFEERMLAEEKIILQNEYLNSIMESLTHPFYVIDANDHTIKMANSASGFGPLTRESKCYSMTHKSDKPCDEPEHPCTIREIKRTNKPVILEHIHYDNKGNTKVIEVHGYPIYDKEGKVVEVIEYTIDITERKKQEEELLRFSNLNAIGRLAVGIAHEINNPLTNASLGMQILKKKFIDITANKNILQKFTSIENSVDRASIIAKELLEFSRQKDIELSPSNINDLIHGALTLMEFKFSNVKIHKELADLPEILGNPVKLEHVFLNVLSNSAEAMPDGGDIFISTSFVNSEVIVKISDTGVGISKENIAEVFEPFFRKKEVGDGTGLGLAISYSIIKEHKGDIVISSTEGKGTTVTIKLPISESHE